MVLLEDGHFHVHETEMNRNLGNGVAKCELMDTQMELVTKEETHYKEELGRGCESERGRDGQGVTRKIEGWVIGDKRVRESNKRE